MKLQEKITLLWRSLRGKSESPSESPKEVYFHEDDYCQVELVPMENTEFILRELQKVVDFSEAHRAEDGIGYTQMYMREYPPASLLDQRIHRDDFARLLEGTDCCPAVYTGYSDYREPSPRTTACRHGKAVLFFECNEDGFVRAIWFNCFLEQEHAGEDLCCLLGMIAKAHDLLFVDWNWNYCARIRDKDALHTVIAEHVRGLVMRLQKNRNIFK